MNKYALRLPSQVLSCCLCFKRHFFLPRSQGKKKKNHLECFPFNVSARLQQINKPCCLAAETRRNIHHQSSDDGNGTTGMLNFSGWCVGTAGVALDPFKAFLYVSYQLACLPFFGILGIKHLSSAGYRVSVSPQERKSDSLSALFVSKLQLGPPT